MLSILHLVDPASPGGGAFTLRMIADLIDRDQSANHRVLILGNQTHVILAERCGLRPVGAICAPRGVRLAERSLRQWLHAAGRVDIIHAWTIASAVVGRAACHGLRAVAFTASIGPIRSVPTIRWLTQVADGGVRMMVMSASIQQEYAALGLSSCDMKVVPPSIDPHLIDTSNRAQLRAKWGIDDDTFLVGLMAEPLRSGDAQRAVSAVGRVAYSGHKVGLLMHPGAKNSTTARRWSEQSMPGVRDVVVFEEGLAEPWNVLSGLDGVLMLNLPYCEVTYHPSLTQLSLSGASQPDLGQPGVMPLLWSMIAGLPVITDATPAADLLVRDGSSGLISKNPDINGICRHLLKLVEDPSLAASIGQAASNRAKGLCAPQRFVERVHEVYQSFEQAPLPSSSAVAAS